MNKDPEERWQTARDLAGELKWILEDLANSGTSAASRTQREDGQKALPPSFIEGLRELGYQRIPLEEVIRLRDHGVSPEFIEGLKRAGYAGLPIDQLIRLQSHGVTPEYIEKMKAQGFKSLSIDQLVKRAPQTKRATRLVGIAAALALATAGALWFYFSRIAQSLPPMKVVVSPAILGWKRNLPSRQMGRWWPLFGMGRTRTIGTSM